MSVPTPEQLDRYKASFEEFDDDKDGYIDVSMIERALRSIGLNPSSDDINDIMTDVSSSNRLSLNSYLYIAYHVGCYANTEKQLLRALTLFDKDGTGKIHKTVVKEILTSLKRPFTDGQIEKVFNTVKIDNGYINIKQLAQVLVSQ